jgi:RimJ/RimL family protein N-acetyltransferase
MFTIPNHQSLITNHQSPNMKYILATQNLRLREFTLDDTAFVIELLNTEGWLKFVGNRHVQTHEQAKAYLENGAMKSYATNGFGLSLVEMKENNTPIGMCGIIRRENMPTPDIGFALLPAYIGKGLGYEIAAATLKHAKYKLHLPNICGITLPENVASIRVLEKIGLRFIETIQSPDSEEVLSLYGN